MWRQRDRAGLRWWAIMKLSGSGLCAALWGSLLLLCALGQALLGLRCRALGSSLRDSFHLGSAAGAFYSGLLVAAGQLLLGAAVLLCRDNKPGCRNLLLVGVLLFLLGLLTAFSGAVVDGDAAALLERKFSRYCLGASDASTPGGSSCRRLRDYQRSLVVSTVLSTLEVVLGLLHLLLLRRYKAGQQLQRQRQQQQVGSRGRARSSGDRLCSEDRDCSSDLQPVSYINLGLFSLYDETGAEVQRGGHPSIELPGYSPSDPELNRTFPFSYPLPCDLPPAYEDIFPAEAAGGT